MNITIEPGAVNGIIQAPASKSMTQRVFAAALLHKGTTRIRNAGSSGDEMAALNIIRQLGAAVSQQDGMITVSSDGVMPIADTIDCGESGLAARLFLPIAALSSQQITVTGEGTLLSRPMHDAAEVLARLGVTVDDHDGHLPFTITGPLQPADIVVDGSHSSQLLSGLLLAYCYANAHEARTISVTDLKSKPYVAMTVDVLQQFGHRVMNDEFKIFTVSAGTGVAGDMDITIDGDWSGAANMLVAGAIAGEVTIKGLCRESVQADSVICALLEKTGAVVSWSGENVTVKKSGAMAFEFDATDCPDLIPILCVLAACCVGESYIGGVHRLFHKESNRVESISEMLENFGVPYSVEDDAFCITGVKNLHGTVIDSYHDHRIAMAAAVGALRASGPVEIVNAESVSKSYPAFFEDMGQLKVKV